jgi:hypothetical protein
MSLSNDVKKIIKPGDVILFCNPPHEPAWWDIWNWMTSYRVEKAVWDGIITDQHGFFGMSPFVDTNHVVFFDGELIIEAIPPKIRLITLDERLKDDDRIIIMRPNFYTFTPADGIRIRYLVNEFIGQTYDYLHCLEIMISSILGYPTVEKVELYDPQKSNMVCSTLTRTCFETFRKTVETEKGADPYPTLFSQIVTEKFANSPWKESIIKSFNIRHKLDVEMTLPAHFMPDVQDFYKPGGYFFRVFQNFT